MSREETPTVRREIVIEAPPERVFDAWADPEEIARWYVTRQVGDPRRDPQITWHISSADLEGTGEPLAVRAAERGRRLLLENVGEAPWRGSTVDVQLFPEAAATRVAVIQSGFSAALHDHVPLVDSGWACVLAILKTYVERHGGQPRNGTEALHEANSDPARVTTALASAEAIAEWAGERPAQVLAATPHGAVTALAGYPGLFTFMGVGGAVVWYTAWGDVDVERAQAKAQELAGRLAARIERPPSGSA